MALNAERTKEEAAGVVRWLRPEYQIPRLDKGVAAAQEGKSAELDLPEIARGFKRGGRRVEGRVTQVLGTLVRYGRVTAADNRYAA